MRRVSGFVVLALWAGLACGAEPTLAQRQADARKQQTELRERIQALQKEIDSQESSRRDAAQDLKASESAISSINLQLSELAARQRKTEHELKELDAQIAGQKHELGQRQQELGDQLRAQYASGLSPWTALLSGDDPQVIGRDLSYLGYISQAQADAVRGVRRALDSLAALQARSQANQKELIQLAQETAGQKASLQEQKAERQKVLERIESLLHEQRSQAQRLERNDKRLGDLVGGLEKAIAKQAEEARLAEERRKAEAARRAEQARLAALEQRRALERERAAARKAEQAAQAAQERARRLRDEKEAEKARLQVEAARAQARAAEEAAARPPAPRPEPEAVEAESIKGSVPGAGQPRLAPAGGFAGLKKGAPYPVRGDVLGRFGAERPEGGLWRGIVLRSPEGAKVHAIAPGRVVYANWLSGFGNIVIVDHGAKYLSVYAYNQSLLKRVGDIVDTGDTIATVGATGGQVDSGLYFEIRHQGTPVNPLLWLRQ
ncbi:murein hydrolase activator EnvC family protein [Pollutimonas bauzanensis]|uniref:Septal ring factor EnvC, activator of murein hydrolases AmiA and AmiB n=1 Tax=Pollutimonas bauzanensis TaxID=658167 RepID=A0A1M5REM0_9BURK|nr:peptidoglycan DD-metalloendopeptidase family protein [Pollutimonas bauzanensis]SHH24263.1 Septal ring factor EnvC, activator of murein hydrolases AmiA and AmiB [Pollutimonas bauzanensis]